MTSQALPAAAPGDALEQHVRLLRLDPANISLLAETVHLALEAGQITAAAEAIDAALRLRPGEAPIERLSSHVLLAQQRSAEAETVLRSLERRSSLDPAGRFDLGYALFRQARYGEAAATWQALIAQANPPAGTLAWLLRALRLAGGTAAALQAWDAAPDGAKDGDACAVAALAALDAGDMARARELTARARTSGANAVEAVVGAASIAIADGKATEAIPWLEATVERHRGDTRLWSTLALAHLRASQPAKACAAAERAVEIAPGDIAAWHLLGWSQSLAGDAAQAERSFRHAVNLDPQVGESHGGAALMAAAQGRRAEALAAAERALALDPTSPSAAFARAVLSGAAADRQALERVADAILGKRAGRRR